jgi:serine/threonine protein kinase
MPHILGYTDLAVIGHGASATVYRALQEGFDRMVALKVLNVDVSDRRAQKRFHRERSLNGRLSSHPNVVTVLDSGFVDGRRPYLAMELLEHGSLADRLADRGPFDVALTLHIGVRIAGALESAHRLGILHRDVKPQNILLSRFGEPALADFGISTILEMEQSLTAALTPVHAAPEVLEGGEPTALTDVYALGSTIFTLLAGSAPFVGPPGEGMLAQLLRITTSDVPPLPRSDVPASLVELLRSAMAKRPNERIAGAGLFGEAMQRVQRELGLPVTPLPVDVPDMRPASTDSAADIVGDDDGESEEPWVASPAPIDVSPSTLPPPQLIPAARPVWNPVPPPPAGGDHTVGMAIDSPTVIGRQHHPSLPTPVRPRRRWITPLVVAGAVVIGAGGTIAITAAVTRDDTPSVSTTSTTNGAPSSTQVDVAALAPTGLTASTDAGSVVLKWQDNTDGRLDHVVYIYKGTNVTGNPDDIKLVRDRVAFFVVPGMDPTTDACFIVAAIVKIGENGLPVTTANSTEECINNAHAEVVATQP